jgi:hypothetical protein
VPATPVTGSGTFVVTPVGIDQAMVTVGGMTYPLDSAFNLIGAGSDNTLQANDALENTWAITVFNSGTLTLPNGAVINFSSVQNLTGGSGDDIFCSTVDQLNTQGGSDIIAQVDGTINGGGGTNTLDFGLLPDLQADMHIDLQQDTITYDSYVLSGDKPQTIRLNNIQAFIAAPQGQGTTDLIGKNLDATWTVNGAGAGSVQYAGMPNISFTGVSHLKGGTYADTFNVTAAPAGGLTLDGADGSDTYNIYQGGLDGQVTVNDTGISTVDTNTLNLYGSPEPFPNEYWHKDDTTTTSTWIEEDFNQNPIKVEIVHYPGIDRDNCYKNIYGGDAQYHTYNDPGSQTTIYGGPGDNTFIITATSGNGVVLNGGGGANNYIIDMASLAGPVTVNNSTGTSTLTVLAPPGTNTLTLSATQLSGAGETINLNLGTTATNITVDGSAGTNQLVLQGPPRPVTGHNITVVDKVASAVAVASSVNPSFLGQAVTFTATVAAAVSPGAAVPTGAVQFRVDGVNVGAPVPLVNGVASFTTTALPAGPHAVAVLYLGDDHYNTNSAQLTQAVRYNFGGFLPPLDDDGSYKLGRDLPIKFRLTDYNGNAVTSLSAVRSLQVQSINAQGQPTGTPFNPAATAGTVLRYDPASQQFIFNWDTSGLTLGYYRVLLTLDDGTLWTLDLRLK